MMRRIVTALFLLAAITAASRVAHAEGNERCRRIVSLAPSVTEVLFELGLGPSVVGVSRYDRYPTAVREIPRIGGLFDPNFEVIVGLEPTIVVALYEFREKIGYAQSLGLPIETVDHRSVKGILDSFVALGKRCGVETRAKVIVSELRGAMEQVASRAVGRKPVRAMIVVGGGSEGAIMKSVFVSGQDGFYDELLRLAGGENVVRGETMALPTVSGEGLLALDPEVIIQVRNDEESRGTSAAEIVAAWRSLAELRAVQTGRVFVVSDDYVTIPGPRFVKTLARFAEIFALTGGSER